MVKVRALLLFAALALVFFTSSASATGRPRCQFTGTVKLDGDDVPGGTLITAIVDGDEYHTHTPTGHGSSRYAITIRPPEGKDYPDGTEVAFKISGYWADQTGTFRAGANVGLGLTASTTVPAASANVWVIIGLVLGAMVVGGVAYYLVLLQRVLRKRVRRTR